LALAEDLALALDLVSVLALPHSSEVMELEPLELEEAAA